MSQEADHTRRFMKEPLGAGFSITHTNVNSGATSTNAIYTGGSTSGISSGTTYVPNTAWDFYQNLYYPYIVRQSYPVYLQERAEDKGKKAFEILKVLQDKKLMKLDKVSDFIEAMDCLINSL